MMQGRINFRNNRHSGVAALWVIIWMPAMLVMLCFVVNVSTLWLARVELENAMESAALAAVHEWGKNPTSTEIPRNIGVEFASFNRIRGVAKEIGTNLGTATVDNPNANLHCVADQYELTKANLIFGAITSDDPAYPVTFDASKAPSCGAGGVLVDATGQGNLCEENAWGIAFLRTADTPPDLRIKSVLIDLRAGGGGGSFDGDEDDIEWADNVAPFAVNNPHAGIEQPDIKGIDTDEVSVSLPRSYQLLLAFETDDAADSDARFDPGDRLRFGFCVDGVSKGSGSDDGDGVGRDDVTVTVTFEHNGIETEVSGTLVDTEHRSNDCLKTSEYDPYGDIIVHPSLIPNLPCPAASAPKNNGQSYVVVGGQGQRKFAVRAQAFEDVRLFGPQLFSFSSRRVYAKATAEYDCSTGEIRLIRVDRFICP